LKVAVSLWQELCHILTDLTNYFTTEKRTKLPKILEYNHSHLKHVATLPCEMQNYRKLCKLGAAELSGSTDPNTDKDQYQRLSTS